MPGRVSAAPRGVGGESLRESDRRLIVPGYGQLRLYANLALNLLLKIEKSIQRVGTTFVWGSPEHI